MTPADCAELLTLAAAFDNRTPSETAARAWAGAIDDAVTPADAKQIIIDHYARERTWIMPSDINASSAMVRRSRITAAERDGEPLAPPESLDGDVLAEIAWQRTYWRSIGDGASQDQADRLACVEAGVIRPALEVGARPVMALVQQVSDALPRIPRSAS